MECLLALIEVFALAAPVVVLVRLFPGEAHRLMEILGFDGEPYWTRR